MMTEMFAFMKILATIYDNLVGFEEKKPLNDATKLWMNEDSTGLIRIVHSLYFDHFFLEVWISKT